MGEVQPAGEAQLHEPKLNLQMLRVLDKLEYDDNVGVLALSGEGTAWSAGMDLKEYFRETEAKSFVSTVL